MRLIGLLSFSLMMCGFASGAIANPFGVGLPAEPVPGFGFEALIVATAQAQADFYQGLTNALRAVADSTAALWTLLGLSFAYGVVHAAGPGHGKVVIGSYMLASGDTARRGALLAFGAAMLQASVAVGLVGILAGLFGLSQAVLSSTTITLERFGYGLIIALGLYLLFGAVRGLVGSRAVHVHSHAHAHAHADSHGHADHVHDEHCGCGHSHVPDADAVAHNKSLSQTLALIVGAGLRPCTGALLVLVLALSQNLFWAGSLAAYAMGAGTALMVGFLAIFASGLARFFQSSERGGVLRHAPTVLAVLGSLAIVCFGALLLAASLAR